MTRLTRDDGVVAAAVVETGHESRRGYSCYKYLWRAKRLAMAREPSRHPREYRQHPPTDDVVGGCCCCGWGQCVGPILVVTSNERHFV